MIVVFVEEFLKLFLIYKVFFLLNLCLIQEFRLKPRKLIYLYETIAAVFL